MAEADLLKRENLYLKAALDELKLRLQDASESLSKGAMPSVRKGRKDGTTGDLSRITNRKFRPSRIFLTELAKIWLKVGEAQFGIVYISTM